MNTMAEPGLRVLVVWPPHVPSYFNAYARTLSPRAALITFGRLSAQLPLLFEQFDLDAIVHTGDYETGAIARACEIKGSLLVVDEAYALFCGFDHLALHREFENVILLRSLSKSFGVAGLRAAFVVAQRGIIDYLQRFMPSSGLAGPTIAVVRRLLASTAELDGIRRDITATRDWFQEQACRRVARWTALPSAANFINFWSGSVETAQRAMADLKQRRILVRAHRELPGYVRFGIADRSTMELVLEKMEPSDGWA